MNTELNKFKDSSIINYFIKEISDGIDSLANTVKEIDNNTLDIKNNAVINIASMTLRDLYKAVSTLREEGCVISINIKNLNVGDLK